jgi:hypothetical protein
MFGIDDAIAAGLKILDKFVPDPAAKAEAEAALRATFLQWDTAQTEVNKVEAASGDKFASRWRPFIGWTCGAAFAWHFVLAPVANFFVVRAGDPAINIAFDMNTLLTVLMGLLGLGGLRTYEKIRGVGK